MVGTKGHQGPCPCKGLAEARGRGLGLMATFHTMRHMRNETELMQTYLPLQTCPSCHSFM